MVLRLAKPGDDILKSLTPEDCHLLHIGGCLGSEAGEILEALDGTLVPDFPTKGGPVKLTSEKEVMEECGDWEFYWTSMAAHFGVSRSEVRTKAIRGSYHHVVQLMILGGNFWDVIKRMVIYRKPKDQPDKKFGGKTLEEAARGILLEMRSQMNSFYFYVNFEPETVLEENWTKLADNDKGRYGAGGYSDQAAQDRRDKPEGE